MNQARDQLGVFFRFVSLYNCFSSIYFALSCYAMVCNAMVCNAMLCYVMLWFTEKRERGDLAHVTVPQGLQRGDLPHVAMPRGL